MQKCHGCDMFYCPDCLGDHFCHQRRPEKNPPPKISRIKRKQKQNKNLATDYCDSCHREFLDIDLIKGEEPFQSEVYGKGQMCKLCDRCYKESCDDV